MVDRTIAALFVEEGGCYYGLDGVDPWGVTRDARLYNGPYPVIAHPPCARWSAMWFGGVHLTKEQRKKYKLGDDNGCFKAALQAVRKYGGVLEHPAHTNAYAHFGIAKPDAKGGWSIADTHGGWICQVDQRHYGHIVRKMTWLYVCKGILPQLKWGEAKASNILITNNDAERKKARHPTPFFPEMGVAAIGEKGRERHASKQQASATPTPFRDLLISIARSVYDFQPEQAPRTLFAMPEPVPLKQPYGLTVDLEVNVDSS